MASIKKQSNDDTDIPTPISIANRIVDFKPDADPHSLAPNPLNPRQHPRFQRDVMRGVLGEIGWIGVAIYNIRTQRLIDGHDRRQHAIDHNTTIPVVYVDLSEDEERKAIPIFDQVTSLASLDAGKLNDLLAGVTTSSEAIASLLADLQTDMAISFEPHRPSLPRDDAKRATRLYRFTLPTSDAVTVEKALQETGAHDREQALVQVCQTYLQTVEHDT